MITEENISSLPFIFQSTDDSSLNYRGFPTLFTRSYLLGKLDEVTSLDHDISREVLANDNMTPSQCLGLLQHGASVLKYFCQHLLHVLTQITVSFSKVTMIGFTPFASSSGDRTTFRKGISRDIASWDLITW